MLSYATFSSNELHFLVVTNSLLIFFFPEDNKSLRICLNVAWIYLFLILFCNLSTKEG